MTGPMTEPKTEKKPEPVARAKPTRPAVPVPGVFPIIAFRVTQPFKFPCPTGTGSRKYRERGDKPGWGGWSYHHEIVAEQMDVDIEPRVEGVKVSSERGCVLVPWARVEWVVVGEVTGAEGGG